MHAIKLSNLSSIPRTHVTEEGPPASCPLAYTHVPPFKFYLCMCVYGCTYDGTHVEVKGQVGEAGSHLSLWDPGMTVTMRENSCSNVTWLVSQGASMQTKAGGLQHAKYRCSTVTFAYFSTAEASRRKWSHIFWGEKCLVLIYKVCQILFHNFIIASLFSTHMCDRH